MLSTIRQGKIGKRIAVESRLDLMLTGQALPLCSQHVKVIDTLVELSAKKMRAVC